MTESGVSSGSPSDVSHSAEDSDTETPADHHHHTLPHLHTAVHHHKERPPLKRVVSEPATGASPPPPPPPLPANDFHRQVLVYVQQQQQSARNQTSCSEYHEWDSCETRLRSNNAKPSSNVILLLLLLLLSSSDILGRAILWKCWALVLLLFRRFRRNLCIRRENDSARRFLSDILYNYFSSLRTTTICSYLDTNIIKLYIARVRYWN